MKVIFMFIQVTTLFGIYMLGSWIQETLGLFIPGSIIGMLLLFGLLLSGLLKSHWLEKGAGLLIRYLPLLFLPVTVGIMVYFHIFKGKGLFLFAIVFLSTLLVMLLSGSVSHWIWKRMVKDHD